MHIPMFVWGILFLCILFWVFIFTNHKQLLARMYRSLVAVNLHKFKNIRKKYDMIVGTDQSVENLVQELQQFRLTIQKNIEHTAIILDAYPGFKDQETNKVYITTIKKSDEQLKRITRLAENFESFISKRHVAQ